MNRIKPLVFWSLVTANVLLATILLAKMDFFGLKPAVAQTNYRPADYVMIPGEVAGQSLSIVYVLDQTNNRLGAIAYDDTKREVARMAPVDLGRVFSQTR